MGSGHGAGVRLSAGVNLDIGRVVRDNPHRAVLTRPQLK
jgi:hypothetical protein